MDQKPAPTHARPAVKARAKRGKGPAETARLFLDIEELSRRSQNAPPSRYVE
jgi:hypothetical protein